jgi:arylsulfatase A
MLPYLQGKATSVRDQHVHNTNAKGYAIRSGDWLLIDAKSGYLSKVQPGWLDRHGYPADDQGPVELYDLSSDVGQRHNVADQHPEVVERLRMTLHQIKDQGFSAPRLVRRN